MKRLLSIILVILIGVSLVAVSGCSGGGARLELNTDFKKPTALGDGEGERVKVILLLGQSNATGCALNSYLE